MHSTPQTGAGGQTRLKRAADLAARASSLSPTDPRVRRGVHAGIAIVVALSIALVAFAALGDLPDVEWRFRPVALLVTAIAFGASLVGCAEIWRRILAALGPELPPLRAQAIWFSSGLGRYVPTSLLLPVLRVAMSERAGVSKRICLASLTYEVCLFLAAALVVGAYYVIALPSLADAAWRFVVLVLPLLALVVLHPRVFHTVADRMLMRLGRERLPRSLPVSRVLEFGSLYVVVLIANGVGVYSLSQCVYAVGAGELAIMAGAFAVGTVLSLVAVVLPGGLIAREAGLAVALAPVMPAAPAVAIALLVRIFQLGLELLGAVVAPLLARRAERSSERESAQRVSTVIEPQE